MSDRTRKRVVAAFEDWAGVRGSLPDGEAVRLWRDRIGILLHGRETYLHCPDPTLWRSGDVHRLLVEYVAPRQVDAWGLAEHGVTALRDFLLFLDESQWLHPASTRVSTLVKELDRAAPRFAEKMADPSGHKLAKRVFTAMLADGLSIDSEPAEIDRWAERFSARDAEGRRRVLGELMDSDPGYATGAVVVHQGQVAVLLPGMPADKSLIWPDAVERDCGCNDVTSLPPPPSESELERADAVAGSELLRQFSRLADWVGTEGRPVDRRGEPNPKDLQAATAALDLTDTRAKRLDDVPAFALLWALAVELGVLAVRRTSVFPGGAAAEVDAALRREGSPERAVALWDEVFDELVHPSGAATSPEREALREWAQPLLPRMLGKLYTEYAGDGFVDVERLVEDTIPDVHGEVPAGRYELLTALGATAMKHGLFRLAEHAAVEVDVPSLPEAPPAKAATAARTMGMPLWVVHGSPGARVRLTDLGRRAVHRRLTGEREERVPATT